MDCPEFLKPRLRLFLSADIVGSTALKQSRLGAFSESSAKDHSSWFSIIQGFYIEARRLFLTEWKTTLDKNSAHPELFGEEPKIWKTIGDEVLFVKVLSDHRQLAVTLKCWTAAVRRMRQFLRGRDARLDVKCTAWTAGFPIKNKEVVINSLASEMGTEVEDYYVESGNLLNRFYSEGENSKIEIDFIGPSIDIGFRLSAYSTSRKFVIGVDIPYILALTSPRQDSLIDDFQVYYDGSVPLKGVFGGVNYPIFWIDMSDPDGLPSFEDKLTDVRAPQRDDVRRYCEAFHLEYATYTFRPFIVSETEQQIADAPSWYSEIHTNLIKNFAAPEVEAPDEPSSDDGAHAPEADVEVVSREIVEELESEASGPVSERKG